MKKMKVLAVDDQPLLRKGIVAVLDGEDEFESTAEASSGGEAIELFRIHQPDVSLNFSKI